MSPIWGGNPPTPTPILQAVPLSFNAELKLGSWYWHLDSVWYTTLNKKCQCPMSQIAMCGMSHVASKMLPCQLLSLRNTPCHLPYIPCHYAACRMSIFRNAHVAVSNLGVEGHSDSLISCSHYRTLITPLHICNPRCQLIKFSGVPFIILKHNAISLLPWLLLPLSLLLSFSSLWVPACSSHQ